MCVRLVVTSVSVLVCEVCWCMSECGDRRLVGEKVGCFLGVPWCACVCV